MAAERWIPRYPRCAHYLQMMVHPPTSANCYQRGVTRIQVAAASAAARSTETQRTPFAQSPRDKSIAKGPGIIAVGAGT